MRIDPSTHVGELGLRLDIDHLIEPQDLKNQLHRVGRRDDDQPPTQPRDPFVQLE